MTGSLAYRTNKAAILAGNPPRKYTRILPYIPGQNIVEAGSAEGVLACLLALEGRMVTAIEANQGRHNDALALAKGWGASGITFINGRIETQLDRMKGADTFLAVRAIYYWGEHLDTIFAAVAGHVPNVVLCGNRNRAAAYHAGRPHEPLGKMNYYASAEGMRDVLTRHGYEIVNEDMDGDAIIVGRKEIG